jgi:hypothetical protein
MRYRGVTFSADSNLVPNRLALGCRSHLPGVVAMRKLLMAIATVLFMTGLVVATEVTVVKYDKDKKEVTVKEGDKENTYKFSDKVKISVTDKDGNATEGKFEDLEKRLSRTKGGKGGTKLDITTDKDTITEVKYKGGKKN